MKITAHHHHLRFYIKVWFVGGGCITFIFITESDCLFYRLLFIVNRIIYCIVYCIVYCMFIVSFIVYRVLFTLLKMSLIYFRSGMKSLHC